MNTVTISYSVVVPLLMRVSYWLDSTSDIDGSDPALYELHKFLMNNCKDKYMEAIRFIQNEGVEMALKFLEKSKTHIVKTCQENKELMKALAKTATKAVVRHAAIGTGTKAAIKYGIKSIAGAANVANPAGIAVDVAQAGLEYFDYEDEGKAVGVLGNIGTGICTGFAIGGPVGAAVGALAGFGTWVIGEGTGRAIDEIMD